MPLLEGSACSELPCTWATIGICPYLVSLMGISPTSSLRLAFVTLRNSFQPLNKHFSAARELSRCSLPEYHVPEGPKSHLGVSEQAFIILLREAGKMLLPPTDKDRLWLCYTFQNWIEY